MSKQKGQEAEQEACVFLHSMGFEIIERNFFARYGEIDIVAKKAGILHFIEVKSGQNFEPTQNLTHTKIKRLIKAINLYELKNPSKLPYCLDALIIRYNKQPRYELLENITQI